jgi:hypothetical protein
MKYTYDESSSLNLVEFSFFCPIKLEMHSIRSAKQNLLPTAGLEDKKYNFGESYLNRFTL